MVQRETRNNAYGKFWRDKQRVFLLFGHFNLIKNKANSGYKHNVKAHFTFDLTFRMLQHTSSEVTVEQIQI